MIDNKGNIRCDRDIGRPGSWHSCNKLAALADYVAAANAARLANVIATRAALRSLVAESDPLRPVAELLAASLTIGRDDGFQTRAVSDEATQIFDAAIQALPVGVDSGLRAVCGVYLTSYVNLNDVTRTEQSADVTAWMNLDGYRGRQVELK